MAFHYVAVHNPNIQTFDLSIIASSDGDQSRWPSANDHTYIFSDPVPFLTGVGRAYLEVFPNNVYYDKITDPPTFTALPFGYALFFKKRGNKNDGSAPDKAGDFYLYGHPKGRFESAKSFVPHVHALLNQSLDTCICCLCMKKFA